MARVQHLQALDLGSTVTDVNGLVDRINRRLPGANARLVESGPGYGGGTNHIIEFDSDAARNVSVNNVAYGAGFISNTQSVEQTALDRRFRNAQGTRTAAPAAAAASGNS